MSARPPKGPSLNEDFRLLIDHIRETLREWNREARLFPEDLPDSSGTSAVLLLLSEGRLGKERESEPCIVFTKRSEAVRQSGDLCFPGGRIHPHMDALGARLLGFPFSPLGRWPDWEKWLTYRREEAARLAFLLATGFRESLEEMGLNPFGTEFLGPLPHQCLQPFQRALYPMVVWIKGQKHFSLNTEVEKIVFIPLKDLLNPERYVCYRMHFAAVRGQSDEPIQDFPGFLHEEEEGPEVLWGVTYRIVENFLEMIYGFTPPAIDSLKVVEGSRGEAYFNSGPKLLDS
jgi:8-oxo-dGTP pyrophosphatase MutT (NUDIX family)